MRKAAPRDIPHLSQWLSSGIISSMDIEVSKEIIDEYTLAGIYKALGEPNRLRVVRALLQEQEMTCGQLTTLLGVSASTFSHHIAELIECGLVSKRKDGRHHILSLRRDILIRYAPAIIEPARQNIS